MAVLYCICVIIGSDTNKDKIFWSVMKIHLLFVFLILKYENILCVYISKFLLTVVLMDLNIIFKY